jgi:RND family efflux transporter MFP subunit
MHYLLYVVFGLFAVNAFAQQAPAAIDVNVVYPVQSQSSRIVTLSGTVEAKQHAQLASLESGLVSQLLVEIGDIVVKGQALLILNDSLAKLQVERATATLQAANVDLAEAERLYNEVLKLQKQQVVAQTLIAERAAFFANAQAQIARTQADVALQQEILARHTLRAPFDGVIASRNIDVGEWLTQQSAVLTLVDQTNLRLTVAVPQQYYRYLAKAKNVSVQVLPDTKQALPIAATLSRFVPVSNSTNRAFTAQIDLTKNDDLVAGMSARAEIEVPNTNQNMIILPLSAVKLHPDGGSSVFVIENGKAKRVITRYIDLRDGTVAITGQPFDKAYVVSGVEVLTDGSPVNTNDVSAVTL